MKPERTIGEPHDRLTRIGNRLLDATQADPEYVEGDKVIVFLVDKGPKLSGISIGGYEGDAPDLDAMADLLVHLTAVFEANGKQLKIVALGRG